MTRRGENRSPLWVAVIGSRDYPNLPLVRAVVGWLAAGIPNLEVVSGGAVGVDSEAAKAALAAGATVDVHPADWRTHGRRAGWLRNRDMVAMADYVVAFWDGKSKGTKLTIDLARRYSKPLRIIGTRPLPSCAPGAPS